MEQNKDGNQIQPDEKQGRDINNRSDIPKAHTGNPDKSGVEGDQSQSMGSGGQFSARDDDEKYGKETGNLDNKNNTTNQQSNKSEQKTPAGTPQSGTSANDASSKTSGSGPSNT